MTNNESSENYLETILILSRNRPVVRSIDVATQLDFKKSSVSVAMKKQSDQTIYERHQVISAWLTGLGVDPKVASEDACRIEHVISAESFAAMKKYIKA